MTKLLKKWTWLMRWILDQQWKIYTATFSFRDIKDAMTVRTPWSPRTVHCPCYNIEVTPTSCSFLSRLLTHTKKYLELKQEQRLVDSNRQGFSANFPKLSKDLQSCRDLPWKKILQSSYPCAPLNLIHKTWTKLWIHMFWLWVSNRRAAF